MQALPGEIAIGRLLEARPTWGHSQDWQTSMALRVVLEGGESGESGDGGFGAWLKSAPLPDKSTAGAAC